MDIQKIWRDALLLLQQDLGIRIIETWFRAIVPLRFDLQESVVYFRAPNSFTADWIVKHYKEQMVHALARSLSVNTVSFLFIKTQEVHVDIIPARSATENKQSQSLQEGDVVPVEKRVLPHDKVRDLVRKSMRTVHLPSARPAFTESTTKYTFETFIEGPHNTLAYHAARSVCEEPGGKYNPFFIYGASGLGKTHLLYALSYELKKKFPAINIVYQQADRFVQEFIQAIRQQKMPLFAKRYQEADVLLVDDIQCIADKEQTQDAFFRIFNALHQAGKQIVCTSDVAPVHMQGFADRMRSRLEWGLVADIGVPPLETRIVIIKRKAELLGQVIDDAVAEYVAIHFNNNVRALEGALTRLIAQATVQGVPITPAFAVETFKDLTPTHEIAQSISDHDGVASVQQVMRVIEEYYEVSAHDLCSPGRDKKSALVRHMAMYCMKVYTKASLKKISAALGRRDHSTVLHGYYRIARLRDIDTEIAHDLKKLEDKLRQSGIIHTA